MPRALLPCLLLASVASLASCASRPAAPRDSSSLIAAAAFWSSLQALCGQSFEGRMTVGTDPGDSKFGDERMVMHVRDCGPDEIRIPFDVGEDRSRTWVVTRQPGGLRLKHDHRHPDGTEDEITWYGGDSREDGTATTQRFAADDHTAKLLPRAATNVWTLEVHPGRLFAYALQREAEGRHFRVEFDLARESTPAGP